MSSETLIRYLKSRRQLEGFEGDWRGGAFGKPEEISPKSPGLCPVFLLLLSLGLTSGSPLPLLFGLRS
jgi:hypothetical protein